MSKIPTFLSSWRAMLLHALTLPIFFLVFILFYESEWMITFLESDSNKVVFNALMLFSILIGVVSISRSIMIGAHTRLCVSWWQYTVWCLIEMIIFSCFAALYMALMHGNYGYFPALGQCMKFTFTILPYPYLLLALLLAYTKPDEQHNEEQLIRFTENTGRLKLVIASEVLVYVEAQENYVHIHYTEGDIQKEYSLRQSMRGIEELMEKHGIVRCQRSYFVNPKHVTVLRRDKEGIIQAELDIHGMKAVPVSPKYYDQLSKML